MPSHGHTAPPEDHPPCECGGCQEFRAITQEPRREYDPPVRPEDVHTRPEKPPARRVDWPKRCDCGATVQASNFARHRRSHGADTAALMVAS